MHHNGQGVQQDDVRAYMWILLAIPLLSGGDLEHAVQVRDIVEDRLTASQQAEARRMARDWASANR